jgi:hypothetical protein
MDMEWTSQLDRRQPAVERDDVAAQPRGKRVARLVRVRLDVVGRAVEVGEDERHLV